MNRRFRIYIGIGVLAVFFISAVVILRNGNEAGNENFSLAGLLNSSEDNKELTEENYISYISDPANGLLASKQIGELNFSAQLLPRKTNKNKKSDNLQYFRFRISSNENLGDPIMAGVASPKEAAARQYYFTYQAQPDFTLVSGTNSVPCSYYNFEPSRGVAPYVTMTLAFPAKSIDGSKDITLKYSDNQFNIGDINLVFHHSSIAKTPKLKTHEN